MTAQDHADTVVAAINAQFATACAYDLDKVPAARPDDYVEVSVSRRFGGTLNVAGTTGVVGYRVACRAVSRTEVANVRHALEKCRAALEFKRLSVSGGVTTPVQFETEDPAGSDDGWFSGLVAFTYAFRA